MPSPFFDDSQPRADDAETQALVERARAGDRAAFEALAEHCRARLARVVERRLGPAVRGQWSTEDVVQETLLRAFRSLDRFEWRDDADRLTSSFFRWLSGIANRVVLEAAARQKREAPIELDFDLWSPDAVSPSRTLIRAERLAALERALDALSPDQRQAIRLVRIEGLSVNAVAERMGRQPNAVSQLILRGLRRLRAQYGEASPSESFHLPDVDLGRGLADQGGESDGETGEEGEGSMS